MAMMDYDFGPSEEYLLRKKFENEYDSMEAPNKSRSLYVAQKLADHYDNISDSHNSLIANNTRDAIIYINSNYYYIYNNVIIYAIDKFASISDILKFLSVEEVFSTLLPISIAMGVGIGFFGSFSTVRKHLKV